MALQVTPSTIRRKDPGKVLSAIGVFARMVYDGSGTGDGSGGAFSIQLPTHPGVIGNPSYVWFVYANMGGATATVRRIYLSTAGADFPEEWPVSEATADVTLWLAPSTAIHANPDQPIRPLYLGQPAKGTNRGRMIFEWTTNTNGEEYRLHAEFWLFREPVPGLLFPPYL